MIVKRKNISSICRFVTGILLTFLIALFSFNHKVEAYEYESVEFTTSGNNAYIRGYIGNEMEAYIPEKVYYNDREYPVIKISSGAFSNRDDIQSVVIPSSVTLIAESAFYNCTALTDIYFNGSREQWDNLIILPYRNEMALNATVHFNSTGNIDRLEYVFNEDNTVTITGCDKNVTEIAIPERINGCHVTEIDNNAFSYCTELKSVKLNPGIVRIGDLAFSGCINLEEIEVPESVTQIGRMCFNNCGLKSFIVPEGVNVINDYAFYGCTNLTNIVMHDNIKQIGNYAFYNCRQLSNIDLPNIIYSIGDNAFQNCIGLNSITIPGELSKLGTSPFSGCTALENIYVNEGNRSFISKDGVLFSGDMYELICYPANKTGIVYEIPEDTRRIGNSAFYSCKNLQNIILPEMASYIEDYVFVDCIELTDITVPQSLLDAGVELFYGCVSLKNIYYSGTETEWDFLMSENTASLKGVNVHYNYSYDAEMLGDVNGDKFVNAADALCVLKHAARIVSLDESDIYVADVNKDKNINSEDALMILKYAANLIESFD